MDRAANLLGALALRVTDRLGDGGAAAAGRGARAPAALVALRRERWRTVEELRRVVGLSQPAAVRLVDRLEADGLVRRSPGPDGRTVTPVLSPAGRRAADAVLAARAARLEAMLGVLEPSERRDLERLLDKLLLTTTEDADEGHRVCRLCDVEACCRFSACPVDIALDETAGR